MKIVRIIALSAPLCLGFVSLGCETSHTETDKPNLIGGGSTQTDTTTTHNPITNTDDTSTTVKKTNQ
jgi:hypothetical protein